MLRRRWLWIAAALLAIIIMIGGYYYYTTSIVVAQGEEAAQEVQTATVRRGEIVISATGGGTVIPATEVSLSYPTGGVLVELLVGVGDKVQAGDILARLDNTDALESIATAEISLAQAELQLDEEALAREIALSELEISQAEMTLAQAQETLDSLVNWSPNEDEVALAEANLTAAQAQYYSAAGSDASKQYNVDTAHISLEQAQRDLAAAQENYDNAIDSARDWEPNIDAVRDQAANALQRAQDNLAIAEANYNSALANATYAGSNQAQSGVLSAEQTLADVLTGPSTTEIEEAQMQVVSAELALRRSEAALESLQDTRSSELSLAQAQLNLDKARAALDDTVLVATMDGTVMSVAGNVGEMISAGPFITLADLDSPVLEVYLDETDLDKVGGDFEVDVFFDALPDETFTGQVFQVDPQLQSANGVTVVRALVQLDYNKPQTLPVGLNATVDVIGGRATDTLLVPVEAIREISPDQFAVFVMVNGEPELRLVEVGLMDFTFAEIISGVEEGDVVTTGIIETE